MSTFGFREVTERYSRQMDNSSRAARRQKDQHILWAPLFHCGGEVELRVLHSNMQPQSEELFTLT